jgi:myo-inositol catabolism protein IolH
VLIISLNIGQFSDRPMAELAFIARDLGYTHVEISPREDFIPLFAHPRTDGSRVRSLAKALGRAGVGVSAVYGLFRWTSLDEDERRAAVRYLRRTVDIAGELGGRVITSEFGVRSAGPLGAEAQFWKSMDDVLPLLEEHDMELRLEPHPGDFVEDGNCAVDMLRGLGSERIAYLYCVPHTFCMGGDLSGMIRYAGPLLRHIHVADVFNERRYIVNPTGASVRVHQHLNIGQGEIDWDEFFTVIRDVSFDGTMSACVSAWPDRAEESARSMRASLSSFLAKYPSGQGGQND